MDMRKKFMNYLAIVYRYSLHVGALLFIAMPLLAFSMIVSACVALGDCQSIRNYAILYMILQIVWSVLLVKYMEEVDKDG